VKYLLSHGADINLAGGRHGSALQAAACREHDEITKLLLKHRANVNAEGGKYGTALIAAAANSRWAILKFLLGKGAGVNRTSKKYGTAMHQCLMVLRSWELELSREYGNENDTITERFMKELESAATGPHRLVRCGGDPNISGTY
jgi:ankyrin repeat protein